MSDLRGIIDDNLHICNLRKKSSESTLPLEQAGMRQNFPHDKEPGVTKCRPRPKWAGKA